MSPEPSWAAVIGNVCILRSRLSAANVPIGWPPIRQRHLLRRREHIDPASESR